MRLASLAPAIITIVLAASPAALAQSVSLSDSLAGPARDAFTSAEVLMNNSDFGGALAKYEQAYEASKDPRLLFNMAICARNLKEYARMQGLLTRYEREAAAKMSADERANVEAALSAIRNLVGTVRVTASQEGASVTVDGRDRGLTPLAEPIVLDLGEHKVTVSKAGFKAFEQPALVQGGAEMVVAATLVAERHVAQLVVGAEEGATILVDGTNIAKGRYDGQLAPGPHDVEVTEPGKLPYRAQVDLHDGETRTVDVTLESEKPHGAPVWPWLVAGGAAVIGLGVGGYFLFKSSPETQQAPLSGSLGSVRFSAWSL
jgi:hypothetical protein